MKQQIYTLLFLSLGILAKSQNADVEKNLTGIQAGFFGANLYHETKIAEKTTLRGDINLNVGAAARVNFVGNSNVTVVAFPSVRIQPRYYYNIAKRAEKGKNTLNNSANYLSLNVEYVPEWVLFSNKNGIRGTNQIRFVPTYGIRRNFAQNFNYEFNVGLGYATSVGYPKNSSGTTLDLSFKIGYDF